MLGRWIDGGKEGGREGGRMKNIHMDFLPVVRFPATFQNHTSGLIGERVNSIRECS